MSIKNFIAVSLSTLALTGSFALTAQAEDTTTPPATPKRQIDLACMVSAVDKRESAIGSAMTAFSSARQSALTARQTALHAAWGMTDAKARRAAIKAAWTTFRTANRTARSTHNTAIKTAWTTFKADAKTCKGNAGDEAGGQGQDNL